MKLKQYILLFLLFNYSLNINATHNRAGEITYKCISPFSYEITVTTYTRESSSQADRCILEIKFGDRAIDSIVRNNGPAGSSCDHIGVSLGPVNSYDIKYNTYSTIHTFPGPGIYRISVEDPNRNEGVINIPNSIQTPFFIADTLVIDPWLTCNNSPILLNPPIQKACVNSLYVHNPGALDAVDGDSLSYSLINCLGMDGLPIPAYEFLKNISIDPVNGTITWDSPQLIGEYNIAILIREWRFDAKSKAYIFIGSVIRDMQITVEACTNKPPVINTIEKVCVEAGKTLQIDVTATDINKDKITLTANGEPFLLTNSPATFSIPPQSDTVNTTLYWKTQCSHVRKLPYQITFMANDNNYAVNLYAFKTVEITVVGPAPLNPYAVSDGNSAILNWDKSACSEAIGYHLYRRIDSTGFLPDTCELGVPSYTGYSFVATIDDINNTSYIDNNKGKGLNHGLRYCYMVVAFYPDKAESYASVEFCTELIRDVPIITHVSVGVTDATKGIDTIRWTIPTVFNDSIYPGPYHFKIYRSEGFAVAGTYIGSTATNTILNQTDTFLIDSVLNTKDKPHAYQIVLYSGTDSVRSTQIASSIFFTSVASSNQLRLIWQENVPWSNTKYVVFRYDTTLSQFIILDTVATPTYIDSGLVNGQTYCYYVVSIGAYSLSGNLLSLINYSQQHCGIPKDTFPPCPPILGVNNECEQFQNHLSWTNHNDFCASDVVKYKVYYAPELGKEFMLITTINSEKDTFFLHTNMLTIAGCYAVTAIDSFDNESQKSNSVCVDNCPYYELPNVFSPNNDGVNDFLRPFPYRYVERIDLKIFNRWEQIVFTTTDPDIKWNGMNQENNKWCNTGVYFYICTVYEKHLEGILPRVIKGYIQLFRENVVSNNN